ncbi:Asp-tRNA(Asn)/Glu-tRNA(Gln) amidotransferase subunit GatA [Acidithrix sp. C25]|uniref:Asp-tRNA(Asn)/Glu-tRNA(Gln) amidotransferase subunit GatA n=1 Tax=Acidithrix sp. C25 TaxID=1671482 RepID=UPI000B13D9DA|nr:Asp-tRNA(Asn)/Glu-tRNA(Gln) amidotransferase subunit GatA [Acidithrix sp. C25]
MEIIELGAVEIAKAVKSGELSALEVVSAHLSEINEHDGDVGAFLLVMADRAIERAKEIDKRRSGGEELGALAGVPVALKDNMVLQGVETTCASKILSGWEPPYTATVIEKLISQGAIPIGKTNLDEFAMGSSTENSAYFPTRNPVKLDRVPGGSSGGSAASVASRFAPIAIGSDTGGSIRQPASLCGVVGVKPTYGLVSRYGLIAFASSLDQIGPFAKSVDDASLVLSVIAGHDGMDSTSSRTATYEHAPNESDISSLRIGVIQEMMSDVSNDVLGVFNQSLDALRSCGAKVETVSIPAVRYGLSSYYLIAPAEASSNLARFDGVRYGLRVTGADMNETYGLSREAGFGPEVKRRIMLGTYALSAGYYDALYGKAQKVRTLIVSEFARAYSDFDVLVSPTSPTVAFGFGDKSDPLSMYMSDVCTIPSNLAGHPAMSVPFGGGADGLPVGVQILAPALSERVMFQVARALEGASTYMAKPQWAH